MSTVFPADYDTFVDPIRSVPGTPGSTLNNDHVGDHVLLNSAVAAVQAKLGKVGEVDPVSIEYRLAGAIAAADAAATDAISALAAAALASSDLADHEVDTGAHSISATVATAIAAHEADLGTAAYLDAGTAVGDLVQVQTGGKLPALDGSALTSLPGGVSDHGALTGLADDDHAQYHTDARGDARYAPIAHSAASAPHAGHSTPATLASAVSAHASGTDVHAIASVTGLVSALAAKAPTASPTFTGTVVGITAAMVGAPSGSGNSTGTNTGDSATPAETTTTVGALLNGATSKTTPVDADQIGLMDSEASNIWKKLSWANLKTALYTALFGTAAPSAKVHITNTTEQLRCGYDAANYLGTTVNSSGVAALEATGGQYTFKGGTGTAPLGSELVTNGTFASSLSGWTDSGATWSWSSGTALHTAGSASTLSQSVTVTSGTSYQLEFVMVGRTTGSVTVTLGSVTANKGGTTAFTTSTQVSLAAADSGSVTLSIVPTADFNGSLDNVTLKSIGVSLATMRLLNSSGSVVCEIRSNNNYNNATGYNAQYSLTTGSYNNATGYNAQYSLTTGNSNNATGYAAQYSLTTGGSNNATGYNAQRSLTTGSYNNATGNSAQYSLTTGSSNNATGHNARAVLPNHRRF
jgi:hypothetical protein